MAGTRWRLLVGRQWRVTLRGWARQVLEALLSSLPDR
jgi:hypothetical protein